LEDDGKLEKLEISNPRSVKYMQEASAEAASAAMQRKEASK
jgi:hypothetical protein